MNKHKKHYCVLALFVTVELTVLCTCTFGFNVHFCISFAHIVLLWFYGTIKGYKLVPFFKKNYPELYEKYPDIRFELTASGFAETLSKAGEEMDDALKAEARELRIAQITFIAIIILWFLPFNMIV